MFRFTLTHEERLHFALCAKDTPGHIALGHLLQCDMDALDDGIPVLADGPWYDATLPRTVCDKLDELWAKLQLEV